MRIVNGRLFENTDKMTCYTHNGESLIDYILTHSNNFGAFTNVTVHDYNEFSNHAPVSFSIKILMQRSGEVTEKIKDVYRWNENCKNEFVNILKNDVNLLQNIVAENESVDCIIDKFSSFVTDRANPFFKKVIKVKNDIIFECADLKERQLWYDENCVSKKQFLQEAIRDFNLMKSEQNRKKVFDARKDYKYYCRKCKLKFKRDRCKNMNDLRKKKPREFWKLFKRKNTNLKTNLSENEFYDYFKQLSSEIAENNPEEVLNYMQGFEQNERESTFCELDEQISRKEILDAIKRLHTNKSGGIDNLINEYFKYAAEILIEPLFILFNKILDSKTFPQNWAIGLIVPIHKKGDIDDPNNYRGITLLSCFAKLFTSVLNERLKLWAELTGNSSDAQFGFKSNHSTIDAAFILKFLIDRQLLENKNLYCAFIDLRKAFDSISRLSMWYKMIKCGIDGKLFSLIQSLYANIKLRVKCFNSLSDLYTCDVGLLQGEIMSPFLFSLFLDDIESHLQEGMNDGINLQQLQLYILLFADDAVLFSETREGLQNELNNLESYCKKWNLTVNVEKTKIVVFRKGGVLGNNDHWFYAGHEIEIVSQFTYLGIVFSSGGSFMQNSKTLAGKALRALHQLWQLLKEVQAPVNTSLNLFDSLVASVLNYGSEIWGFMQADYIERVHRKFCKYLLNVKTSTNNYAVYNELGRYPLVIERYIRIVKYWFSLLHKCKRNCILNAVYMSMETDVQGDDRNILWLTKLKNLLERNGFADVWRYPFSVDQKIFIPLFRRRLIDNFLVELRVGLYTYSSMTLYRELKDDFNLAEYLKTLDNKKHRNAISKLRMSSHRLAIEKGRHNDIARQNRKCIFCTTNDIEDEYHFVLICPRYQTLRLQHIKRYYRTNPSMLKFIQLLNSTGKTLKNLAVYISKAFEERNLLVNDVYE